MIKKGDKLIIVCEALQDENNGTVFVRLPSDIQAQNTLFMYMPIEGCKQAPEPMNSYEVGYFQDGYNQALSDCGVVR